MGVCTAEHGYIELQVNGEILRYMDNLGTSKMAIDKLA